MCRACPKPTQRHRYRSSPARVARRSGGDRSQAVTVPPDQQGGISGDRHQQSLVVADGEIVDGAKVRRHGSNGRQVIGTRYRSRVPLHLRRVVCGARKGGATKLPAAGDITPTICVGAGRCVDAPSRAVVYFSRPDFPLTMAVRGAALANPRAMGVGLWNSL